MADQPPVVDYRPPDPARPRDRLAVPKFALGVGIAVAAGAAGFGLGMLDGSDRHSFNLAPLFYGFAVAPAVVGLVGLCLLPARQTRMVGAGMLAVVGGAALVLGSLCLR